CALELAVWQRVLGRLEADRAPAPPEAARSRALALFDRLEPRPVPLARLLASLRFDSRLQPAPGGARDAGRAAYKLLFTAEGADIDLLCEPEPDGWRIIGQALADPPCESGWRVSIH